MIESQGAPPAKSSKSAAEILAASPVFAGIERAQIETLVTHIAGEIGLGGGADLVRQGEPADAFFILLEGRLDVIRRSEQGRELVIARLEPVQTVGEFALFDPAPRSATLRAVEPCRLLRIPLDGMGPSRAESLRSRLHANVATEVVREFREASQSATTWLAAKLEETEKRVALGKFTVSLLSMVALYMFLMSEVSNRVAFGPAYSIILQAFLILLAAAVALFIRSSPFPRATFGVTFDRAGRVALDALVLTVPLLLLMTALKAAVIASVPRFAHVRLFDFGAPWRTSLMSFAIIEIAYSLFIPLQEFVVRSGLQAPYELFLDGKHRRWTAILVSNIVFSASHLHFGLLFAIAVFPIGVYWGWMFGRQRSLIGVCLSHLLVGNFGFAVLGVEGLIP